MQELIERLKKAAGPGRQLDLEILRVTSGKPWVWHRSFPDECVVTYDQYGPNAAGNPVCSLEGFTASIDAALTLVPELCWARVQTETRDTPPIAWATNETNEHSFEGQGATPAIALCIASLRARAALSGVGRI